VTGSHQRKGDAFELAATEALGGVVGSFGLTVERQTRAGYNRDSGDIHLLMPARASVLATVQCKNVARWEFPKWLTELDRQRMFAHADHAVLAVKRPKVADPVHAYAVAELHEWARLVGEVARLRAEVARLRNGRPVAPQGYAYGEHLPAALDERLRERGA